MGYGTTDRTPRQPLRWGCAFAGGAGSGVPHPLWRDVHAQPALDSAACVSIWISQPAGSIPLVVGSTDRMLGGFGSPALDHAWPPNESTPLSCIHFCAGTYLPDHGTSHAARIAGTGAVSLSASHAPFPGWN